MELTSYRHDKIRARMGEQRLSVSRLAEDLKRSRPHISAVCAGKHKKPKLDTLEAIAKRIGIPLQELFEPWPKTKRRAA